MQVGVALPTMAAGFTRSSMLEWCQAVDAGPFSSISTGERVSFFNPELITTAAMAAALTSRVRIVTNVVVAPLHAPAMLAQQLSTIDVMAQGRLDVGLGVGGRPHDYQATGKAWTQRHEIVEQVARELKRLWSGEPAFEGSDPVGPAPYRTGGPAILAGAMGPKALARAARYADGVTGFSITGDESDIRATNDLARAAWADAGRDEPRLISGSFFVGGIPGARVELERFAQTYLSFLGPELAATLAHQVRADHVGELRRILDGAREAGCEEFIVVPGTWDLRCLEAIAAAAS